MYREKGFPINFTNAAMTAATAKTYRPRFPVCDNTGTQLGVTTNGYERFAIKGSTLVMRAWNSTESNNVQADVILWQ